MRNGLSLLLATSGCSGHAAGTTGVTPGLPECNLRVAKNQRIHAAFSEAQRQVAVREARRGFPFSWFWKISDSLRAAVAEHHNPHRDGILQLVLG